MSVVSERVQFVKENYTESRLEEMLGEPMFPYRLTITIPGTPVSDGRPRTNHSTQHFYNEKKEFLKKIFREIYKKDERLRKLCITTPHRIIIKTYSYPTKLEMKYMSDKEILTEEVLSITAKDNDNVEKVNWDVLQDSEFMILLNDQYTVWNTTLKYYSFTPRTVIQIDFSKDYTSELYERKITDSMEYRVYLCSKKYIKNMKNMTDDEAVKYLSNNLINLKTKAAKRLKYILEDFSAYVIDELFRIFVFNNNKNDIIANYIKSKKKVYKLDVIINLLTKKDKECKETIAKIEEEVIYKKQLK